VLAFTLGVLHGESSLKGFGHLGLRISKPNANYPRTRRWPQIGGRCGESWTGTAVSPTGSCCLNDRKRRERTGQFNEASLLACRGVVRLDDRRSHSVHIDFSAAAMAGAP